MIIILQINQTNNMNVILSGQQSRYGANNPMYGKHHSTVTRQRQSRAAIQRNQKYKETLDSQHHVSMDEFLSNNPTVEQYINTLIREQIDKYLWNKTIYQ